MGSHHLEFYEHADSVAMQEVTRRLGGEGFELVLGGATNTDPVVFWAWFRKEVRVVRKAAVEKALAAGATATKAATNLPDS